MNAATEAQRRHRAKFGGSSPADKANSRTAWLAAKWVKQHHPEVWGNLAVQARAELGLPTDIGPNGNFTKPIEHGKPGVGGALAHRYRGEKPCEACRVAYNTARRAARRAKIASAGES